MKTIIILLCFLPWFASSESLRLCQESEAEDPDLPQHTINGEIYYGEYAAIVAKALTSLQYEFIIDRLPWRRCIAQVESGTYDGAIGMGWNDERNAKYYFPEAGNGAPNVYFRIRNVNYPIYVHTSSELSWDGKQFSHVKLGIVAPKGYLVEHKLKELNVLLKTDVGVLPWLSLLKNRRVDGVVITESIGDSAVREDGDNDIRKLEPLFYQQPVFLAFSLKQQKLSSEQMRDVWENIANVRNAVAPLD